MQQIYKVSFEMAISSHTPRFIVQARNVQDAVKRATRKAQREFDRQSDARVTSVEWLGTRDI